MIEPTRPSVTAMCAICQSALDPGEAIKRCPSCSAVYHPDCWEENRGCGIYGCAEVPATEKLGEVDVPASYWGQENKNCPVCRSVILAAAVRCRHCGATFASAKPEKRSEFDRRVYIQQSRPALQRESIVFFVLAAVPLTTLLAATFGMFWYAQRKDEINKLPSLYSGLCKIGRIAAIAESALIVVMVFLFALSHTA